ncbi:MAG: fumarylacetoacetate hydrolase family protein [Clostridiales bacterium]|nr:fumarylacetoacetate hydrolase family protein [Clostridiales bacterium]
MKLITYVEQGKEQIGVLSRTGDFVYPASDAAVSYGSMLELIQNATPQTLRRLAELAEKPGKEVPHAIAKSAVRLLAPIPCPAQDVICLGVNYLAHAEETGFSHSNAPGAERPYPIFFSKRVNRAVADGEPIPAHQNIVDSLDYEAELAVIIGKDAFHVSAEDVPAYIFGYTVLNDVSARNVQTNHQQWYFGKSLDGFTPMGPCIVTADEISFPPALRITATVNGELRQDSLTSLLVTGIAQIVSDLSQGMTLRAGTIISTGTPSGVGLGFHPPKYLKPGDVVVCSIEGIGDLTNTVSE